MQTFFSFLLAFLLIDAVLIGLGIGVAYLLRWFLPFIDLGMGVLIGVLSTGISMHFLAHILKTAEEAVEDGEVVLHAGPDFTLKRLPFKRRKKRNS